MAIKKFNEAWDENSGEDVDYNGYIDQHGEFGDIHDSLGSSKYGVGEFNNMMAELNVNENEFMKISHNFTNKKIFKTNNSNELIKDKDNNLIKINYDN